MHDFQFTFRDFNLPFDIFNLLQFTFRDFQNKISNISRKTTFSETIFIKEAFWVQNFFRTCGAFLYKKVLKRWFYINRREAAKFLPLQKKQFKVKKKLCDKIFEELKELDEHHVSYNDKAYEIFDKYRDKIEEYGWPNWFLEQLRALAGGPSKTA